MVSEARPLTYEDYLDMPDDGRRYEIIDGELLVSPSPSVRHQRVLMHLAGPISEHVERNNLGIVAIAPCTVRITPDEPVEPDIFFVAASRIDIIQENFVSGAPDLIIEILSPTKPRSDLVTKFNRYARAGVREYWIVDPIEETIDQYMLVHGRYEEFRGLSGDELRSVVIEELQLSRKAVFRP